MHKYIFSIVLLFVSLQLFADRKDTYIPIALSDSSQVSILTNTPTDRAVYTMYGHTAVRVKDFKQQIDVVFNYGIFSFDEPDFLYRFVKGETYYWVEPEIFAQYCYRYSFHQVGIVEQVLNISSTDKQKIWDALCVNSLPENRIYLYNFFFDNCATRPRDIVEKNVSSKIAYPEADDSKTFRDLVHECVHGYPWVEFGIDLVLGSSSDEIAGNRDRMFLPIYLKDIYSKSTFTDSVGTRPVVSAENEILPSQPIVPNSVKPYPLIIGVILLVVAFAVSFWLENKLVKQIFDSMLFFVAGVAGCIVFFLMFFSIHPCMSPNWNIAWLNPIMLLVALISPLKIFSKYIYYYHFINFVILASFCLAWFLLPQTLNVAFIPYILSLCLRSGVNSFSKKSHYRIVCTTNR